MQSYNETGHVFELVYIEGQGWTIKSLDSNEYCNNLGGYNSCIGGGSGDGTKFDIYSLVELTVVEADPNAVTEIANGWSGYTTWTLTSDGTLTVSPTEQLFNGKCSMANYHKINGVLTLPWSAYAEQITKVVIEEGVNAVCQMAFYELPNLREVVLADSVEEIRNYAFKNTTSLTTINLEVAEAIREGAFYGCSALENLTFAEGVVIEAFAFSKTPYAYLNP